MKRYLPHLAILLFAAHRCAENLDHTEEDVFQKAHIKKRKRQELSCRSTRVLIV